ncbi:Alpha/Beta hydrolase protein [Gloeopeniophorella convolvens]|nr:Alpha/Beta hydrolase protein [Gloeopeniophorella convolvens]
MSQYAHLSEANPELAALLKERPRKQRPLPVDIPAFQRAFIKLVQPAAEVHQKARLAPEAKYQVQDFSIPVDGGEIRARAIIPGSGDEGEEYPLLFWTHGGGFILGNIGLDDYFLRNLSVDLQVTTLNVEYRVSPEYPYPTSHSDSWEALKWAVNNTDALSVSLDKGFIVSGSSAGANIAAHLALRARDDAFFRNAPITGQYLSCPFLVHTDAYARFPGELLSLEQNKNAPGLNKEATIWHVEMCKGPVDDPGFSPVLEESHANLPPAFLQVCGWDPLRDDGLLYERLLREAGNKTSMKVYPGLPHVFHVEYPTLKAVQQFNSDVRDGMEWLLNQEA